MLGSALGPDERGLEVKDGHQRRRSGGSGRAVLLAVGLLVGWAVRCGGGGDGAGASDAAGEDAASMDLVAVEVGFEDVPGDPAGGDEGPEIDPHFFLDDGAMKTPVVVVMTGGPGAFADVPFLAYRDGDGPWRTLASESPGLYRFHVDHPSGRYEVAVVQTAEGSGLPEYARIADVRVFRATTDETLRIPVTGPGAYPPPGKNTRVVKGSVKGWGALDPPEAIAAIGAASRTVPKTSPSFQFTVPTGPLDLAVSLGGRGFIRRDLATTTVVADLVEEGFDLPEYAASVAQPDPKDSIRVHVDLLTARRTLLPGPVETGPSVKFRVLPADRRAEGDAYRVSVEARLDASRSRAAETFFVTPGDRVLKLPPVHLSGSVTAPGEATVSDYPKAIAYSAARLSFKASHEFVRWEVFATAGWLGDRRTLSFPDLSGVGGFDPSYEPIPGVTPTWELRAYQCSGSVEDLLAALDWGPTSKTQGVPDGLSWGVAVLVP